MPSDVPAFTLDPTPAETDPLTFVAQLDGARWLVRWDERWAIACRVAGRFAGSTLDEQGLRDRGRALTAVRSPRLLPFLGAVARDDAWWMVSERADGVPLSRMRVLCELNRRQATAVALGALLALQDLHRCGWWHGRLTGDDVYVRADGLIQVQGWPVDPLLSDRSLGDMRVTDLCAVRDLAVSLLAATHPRPDWSQEARDEALARLDTLDFAAGSPAERNLGRQLSRLVGDPEQAERTRVDLGALVRAIPAVDGDLGAAPSPVDRTARNVRRRTGRRTRPVALPDTTLASAAPAPPAPARARRRSRPAPRGAVARDPAGGAWVWKAVVALTVLAIVVGMEVGLLGDRVVHDLSILRAPSTHSPSAAPPRTPAVISRVGPQAAGAVLGVSARALRPCTPGRACTLSIVVHVRPQARPLLVHWDVATVDRCTRRSVLRPGGILSIPAGSTSGGALRTVTLPAGKALAVGAVTTEPAHTGSATVPAPVHPPTC